MATIKEVEIISGVEYEIYEYVWKIRNFGLVQESQTRLAQQKFEMELGRPSSDVYSKWLVGLKPTKTVQCFFKLLKITGCASEISIRISVTCQGKGGTEHFINTKESTIRQNEEFVLENASYPWETGQPASAWDASHTTDENGTMILKLKFELLTNQVEQSQNTHLCLQELKKASLKRLHCNYSKLLLDSELHDIKIICNDGVEIGAHRNILTAQNTVFASMFKLDLSENQTGVINVEDVAGKTMKIILHYLYTGELLPEWSKPDTIVEFTYAAGKYQLTEILEMLDSVLGNDEDVTCDLVLLNLTSKLSLKTAEEKLMRRIVKLTSAAKSSKDIFSIFGNGC